MASLVATLSTAVVDSIKEPLDFFLLRSPIFFTRLSQPRLIDGRCKSESDLLSLPWLSADELPYGHIGTSSSNDDAFSGMDWMAEKMDLSEFDLDTLMDSCSTDQTPSSSDDLIASLESAVDLGLESLASPEGFLFPSSTPQEDLAAVPLPDLPVLPEAPVKLEIKSEPPSPVPSPSLLPPLSPSSTLDLGSEVDVSESTKTLPSEKVQVPSFVLSLAPNNIVLLLAPKEEPIPTSISTTTTFEPVGSDSDSDASSTPGSPHPNPPPPQGTGSSRTKPYSIPSRNHPAQESPALTGKVKSAVEGGAPKVVERKLKKMQQNKTAATRYRQKKRAEQEALSSECAELEQRNRELVEKAESISKEIQYLKDLMEEVRKAKIRKNKAES
ncbi:hypothetical protein GJAV_G00222800 [Gymnothorax javanicus]|nr:hypothetical protein GJAV_G00222800 [Gymnothorax javanicus]